MDPFALVPPEAQFIGVAVAAAVVLAPVVGGLLWLTRSPRKRAPKKPKREHNPFGE